jgi:hypothetical protein
MFINTVVRGRNTQVLFCLLYCSSCLLLAHSHLPTHALIYSMTFSFPVAQQLESGLGRLTVEVYSSHSDTPQPVGILWASDQSVAETST